MADNTQLPIPATSGDIIAADDIGGTKFQRVKLIHGADGVNDGDVATGNPLPVQGTVALDAGTLAALETISVAGVATETTLSTIASAVKQEDGAGASGDPGIVLLCQRRDSDTTAVDADGDYATLKTDEAGRLKVSAQPGRQDAITGNITANGQTVFADVSRASNVMMHCFGTFSTVNVTFEGSLNSTNGTDGNWFTIQAVRSNANTIELVTGNLSGAPAYGWELSVNGLKYVRVRATAFTSGTQSWIIQPAPYATEPIPAIQSSTMALSGNNAVTLTPQTSSGAAPVHHHAISAASTNSTSVKTSSGTITDITLSNNGAGVAYFKLYSKTSAPVVGTDTPIMTILIPINVTVVVPFPMGKRLGGIAYAITGGMAVSDTTAILASQVSVGISYV